MMPRCLASAAFIISVRCARVAGSNRSSGITRLYAAMARPPNGTVIIPGGRAAAILSSGRPDRATQLISRLSPKASVTGATSFSATAITISCTGTVWMLVPCIIVEETIGLFRVVTGLTTNASRASIRVSARCDFPLLRPLARAAGGRDGQLGNGQAIPVGPAERAELVDGDARHKVEAVAHLQGENAVELASLDGHGPLPRRHARHHSRPRSLGQKIVFREDKGDLFLPRRHAAENLVNVRDHPFGELVRMEPIISQFSPRVDQVVPGHHRIGRDRAGANRHTDHPRMVDLMPAPKRQRHLPAHHQRGHRGDHCHHDGRAAQQQRSGLGIAAATRIDGSHGVISASLWIVDGKLESLWAASMQGPSLLKHLAAVDRLEADQFAVGSHVLAPRHLAAQAVLAGVNRRFGRHISPDRRGRRRATERKSLAPIGTTGV